MTAAAGVALVHGYLANRFVMAPLGARLKRRGFAPNAWGYWNPACSVLVHAERFARRLEALDADPAFDVLHLVTHSMGGIVARAALDLYRPRKLGRVVMLAPPNHGSFVATRAAGTFGRFLKPVIELSTAVDSLVNTLPMPPDLDLGVIAAEHDALVAEASTRPDAPHDFVALPTWHTGLLFSRETADLVAGFLATGRFSETATPRHATVLSPAPTGGGTAFSSAPSPSTRGPG
jgi:pimeloyl-ACP methyl ester carboxylesterase